MKNNAYLSAKTHSGELDEVYLDEKHGDYILVSIFKKSKEPKLFKLNDDFDDIQIYENGTVVAGCQIVPPKNAEKIAKAILKNCGWILEE